MVNIMMPTWYSDPKAALTFWRGCAHFLSSSVIIIARSSAVMRSGSPSKDNHSPSCLHFCLASQKPELARVLTTAQCPLGTWTRPATRHFFDTWTDSVSKTLRQCVSWNILYYPIFWVGLVVLHCGLWAETLSRNPKFGVHQDMKREIRKKSIFPHTTFNLGLINTKKIGNVTGSTWEQSGKKCVIMASALRAEIREQ